MDTEEVMLKFPQFFRAGEDLDDDTFFYVPERRLFEDFIDVVCDEEPDLAPAEDVLDDVILF